MLDDELVGQHFALNELLDVDMIIIDEVESDDNENVVESVEYLLYHIQQIIEIWLVDEIVVINVIEIVSIYLQVIEL